MWSLGFNNVMVEFSKNGKMVIWHTNEFYVKKIYYGARMKENKTYNVIKWVLVPFWEK